MGNSLTITHSWISGYEHGGCGHTYEVIDYFYILSKFVDTKILLVVNYTLEYFREIIERKYSFSTEEVNYIINRTVIKTQDEMKDIKKIYARIVLVTDGFFFKEHPFISKHLICFPCHKKYINEFYINNLTILQDNRIYIKTKNSINYIKKILLDKIRKPVNKSDKILIYTNSNLRKYNITKYPKDSVVVVTNDEKIDGYQYLDLPVDNIFDEFNEYIYTPVSGQFDCSPRFIVECAYFGKKVTYDIDYYDIGLEVRKQDIKDNLMGLNLTEDDFIVQYIKDLFEA